MIFSVGVALNYNNESHNTFERIDFSSMEDHAYIAWKVVSSHSIYNVDVVVLVDGKQVFSYEKLKPGYYCYNTQYYTYKFLKVLGSKTIEIKAMSFGGSLGSQTSSKTITVYSGEYYDLTFYV